MDDLREVFRMRIIFCSFDAVESHVMMFNVFQVSIADAPIIIISRFMEWIKIWCIARASMWEGEFECEKTVARFSIELIGVKMVRWKLVALFLACEV